MGLESGMSRKSGTKTRKVKKGKRVIYCRDALAWLRGRSGLECIVTSLPEMAEGSWKDVAGYRAFFMEAAGLCLSAVADTGYVVFLQTDRKRDGWIDKSYWLNAAGEAAGMRLLWHKVALRVEVGKTDLYRPGWSHMLCFSRAGRIGVPFADVVERGEMTYADAFGQTAVRAVLEWLSRQGVRKVVDPFVGSGTVVAMANALGMDAVGVDVDKKQCERARSLTFSLTRSSTVSKAKD